MRLTFQIFAAASVWLGASALLGCASTSSSNTAMASAAAIGVLAPQTPAASLAPSAPLKPVAVDQVQPSSLDKSSEAHLSPLQEAQIEPIAVKTVELPKDLWERIRGGFSMADVDSDWQAVCEQGYMKSSTGLYRSAIRSSKYLYHIVEEVERRGLPTELALLPFIESAFNPQALSSAQAAGMWQFIPSTGKHFDLKQNAFRDDRRDVLASTRAALDYLTRLYEQFGDWHLALAAYNWGEGNVSRAIARNQKLGLGTSYRDLKMPLETAQYVPKLLALKKVVAQPEVYGVNLPSIPNHPYFQTVNIKRDMDVSLIAQLAEVKLEDFKSLNPSIHRPVILAAGVSQILLPWDNAAIFERNLHAHRGPLASWTAWVTTAALKPAKAAQKAGMKENEFRDVNRIQGRVIIQAGSSLIVPRSANVARDVAAYVAENGQMSLSRESIRRVSAQRTASASRWRNGAVVQSKNKTAVSSGLKANQKVAKKTSGASRSKASASPRYVSSPIKTKV